MSYVNNFTIFIASILVLYFSWLMIRDKKGLFTRENFSKTSTTLGLLLLFLVMVIWLVLLLLR